MARMAAENPYRAILFGHTHLPYAREVARPGGASTLFVNVGSAGRPKDGDWRVCYAIVDPATSAAGDAPAVEFVRVAYDFGRLQRALAATTLITRFDGPPYSTT